MVRKKVTPEIVEEMKRLRGEGLSYEKIANKLGLAPMTVYNHLRKRKRSGLIGKLKRKLGLSREVDGDKTDCVCLLRLRGRGRRERKEDHRSGSDKKRGPRLRPEDLLGLLKGAVLPRLNMQVLGDGEERMKGRRNPEKPRILDRGDRQAREEDEEPHQGVAEPRESDAGATRRYLKG